MTKGLCWRGRSGLRGVALAVAFVIAGGPAGGAAAAQDGPSLEQRLLACDAIEDLTQRLVCFNAVTAEVREDAAPTSESTPEAAVDTTAAEEEAPATEPAATAAPVASATPAPAEASATAASDFGRDSMPSADRGEDRDKAKKKKEVLQAGIESWRELSDGHFLIYLDNGQAWRETDGSHVRIPTKAKSVEIFRGRFGGYRMRFEGGKRLAWVRRVK